MDTETDMETETGMETEMEMETEIDNTKTFSLSIYHGAVVPIAPDGLTFTQHGAISNRVI